MRLCEDGFVFALAKLRFSHAAAHLPSPSFGYLYKGINSVLLTWMKGGCT